MTKYLNPDLVCRSFKRLSSRNQTGKTHLERTSGLMYFLAFDAACKQVGQNCLDLNPDSLEGKNNRKEVELQYSKLVLVDNSRESLKQVAELGEIHIGGTAPEKRISSNFFTVPLKKASSQSESYHYPRRPPAPLFKMGLVATGKKWGVDYHDDWTTNFPTFLSEIKESTPTLDLAVFVCRDCSIDNKFNDLIAAVSDQLSRRFTKKMADFWTAKIEKERILARHIDAPFIEYHSAFVNNWINDTAEIRGYEKMKKGELIERIHFLEALLTENEIDH